MMKRNFMFIAAIAAGMAMTSCGGEVEVESNLDEVADDTQEQVDDIEDEVEKESSMIDDIFDSAKEETNKAVDGAKKEITDAVTKTIETEAPKAIEETKKAVGM